ncbi:MAG: polysaccharide biosynthesis protein [Geobacteraceae bacterium]|nr:polysaccharide biosynthesis protein [Geobacteraceae bacterium]
MFNSRRFFVFLLDVSLIFIAYTLAYLLRFDLSLANGGVVHYSPTIYVVIVVKSLVFICSRLYRSLWRYASLNDAIEILKQVTLASLLVLVVMFLFEQRDHVSRAIFLIDWVLLLGLMMASRLAGRVYRECFIPSSRSNGPISLIVGAGEAGNMLMKELLKQQNPPYSVIGFIDDDSSKWGMRLHNVPIMGGTELLNEMVAKHNVVKVIIALPSAPAGVIRSIVNSCKLAGVRFKTLPGLSDIINNKVSVSQIKDVEVEDLLGREPVQLDEVLIQGYLAGKRVLVSGAGGSIGSEICRQVARFSPGRILLLDNCEPAMYNIERELTKAFPELVVVPVIADLRSSESVTALFEVFLPEVVFHAAAYKHVPLMEFNPAEAVSNNIGGTRILADAAHHFGAHDFVMVSTDKAVNPTNVMGASKRGAEIYVQALASRSRTKFTTVRFGNVLGSSGSVIPLFKEQIKSGGPLTVTHRDVVRYFMTIPEATQLVLQSACIGVSGDIFVLNMGDPVRIVDLAEELIRLSGFVPYEDIDISFTGLRPGEKLFEELLIDGEGVKVTKHEKIMVHAPVSMDYDATEAAVTALIGSARKFDLDELLSLLKKLVPEFVPTYHFAGAAPVAFQLLRPDLHLDR